MKKSLGTSCFLWERSRLRRPGFCGSVDWVPIYKPKGHWFNSQARHMPGLQPRSLWGACKRQPHFNVYLPLFLKYIHTYTHTHFKKKMKKKEADWEVTPLPTALFFSEIEDTLKAGGRARKKNGLWNPSQKENLALTKAHQSECALALCVQLNFRIAID